MAVLGFLVPLAVLGLIAWAIVGITRRGGEPFTLATATALYARVLLIVGILMGLTGIGIGIILKALFGGKGSVAAIGHRLRSPHTGVTTA